MKKYSRSLALLLALLTVLSLCACSGTDTEDTTEAASTTVPETTETVIEETTEEPSVSVVVPPDTEAEESTVETTEDSTSPPETEPPKATDTLSIIMQTGRGEAVLSGLAEGKYKSLLEAREKALLYEHAAQIELSRTDDLAQKVKNLVLAGNSEYDLLLTDPLTGAEMLSAGLLEDLSGAGFSITSTPGIHESLNESLSVGGRVYLFSADALISDIKSTYALRYNGAALSSDPVAKVLSGDFTAELMLTYIKEANSVFSLGDSSRLTLYRGVGGKVFTKSEQGVPTSALNNVNTFTLTYQTAAKLSAAAAQGDAIFKLQRLTALNKGEIYLPIPKATADLEYSLPIEHTTLSVLAAPAGVVSGNRLSSLVRALIATSVEYRQGARNEIIGSGHAESVQMLDIFEVNARLDLGIILGWGDIDELIEEGLKKGTATDALLSDRMTKMRNKTVDAAAKIIADRLEID